MTRLIVRTRLARFSRIRDARLLSERCASASALYPPVEGPTAQEQRSLSSLKAA